MPTELIILGIFVAFLVVLCVGLAVYEWLNDEHIPDWVKEEDK